MFEFIMAIVMFFSSLFGGFVTFFERLPENKYNQDIAFESITAEETKVSEKEKQLCRDWFDENTSSDSIPRILNILKNSPLALRFSSICLASM